MKLRKVCIVASGSCLEKELWEQGQNKIEVELSGECIVSGNTGMVK